MLLCKHSPARALGGNLHLLVLACQSQVFSMVLLSGLDLFVLGKQDSGVRTSGLSIILVSVWQLGKERNTFKKIRKMLEKTLELKTKYTEAKIKGKNG